MKSTLSLYRGLGLLGGICACPNKGITDNEYGDSEMVEVNVRTKCATRRRNTSEWIPLVERGQAGSGTGVRVYCTTTTAQPIETVM